MDMACIGIKMSPKLNRIFKRKRRGEKKLEDKERLTEEEGEAIGLRKNNFYFSLEVHHGQLEGKSGEVMMLPSSRAQSNVYSWLFSQEEEDCYSEHYAPLSSSISSPVSSSAYSTASEYLNSRLSDPSFSPIQEENSFSKRTDSREKPARSILSEPSSSESSARSSRGELHYASTDILAFPWDNLYNNLNKNNNLHNNTGSNNKLARSGALGEPTEYVYLDFSIPASEGWMVTKKASHWPVRSAYI